MSLVYTESKAALNHMMFYTVRDNAMILTVWALYCWNSDYVLSLTMTLRGIVLNGITISITLGSVQFGH